MTVRNQQLLQRPLSRAEYFSVVRTGLAAGQYLFARQTVLNWLATYPGDLQASLFYAQALAGEKRFPQAIRVLQGLCTADPEYIEAIDALLEVIELAKKQQDGPNFGSGQGEAINRAGHVEQTQIYNVQATARAHRLALSGRNQDVEGSASWGGPLWLARRSLVQGDLRLAEELLDEILALESAPPLAGITHLQYLGMITDQLPEMRRAIAGKYHERWPDTVCFMLRLAEWSFESAQSDTAVALLHQAAARDIEGQVAQRLWGNGHPYISLWPERLRLRMELMVPGIVMEQLGWNRLPSGGVEDLSQAVDQLVEDSRPEQTGPVTESPAELAKNTVMEVELIEALNEPLAPLPPEAEPITRPTQSNRDRRKKGTKDYDVRAVENELEKLAARLKLSGITRQDGRFPIYVIFSMRGRLKSIYGEKIADLLENEMRLLAEAVDRRQGWGGRVFFADDPTCTHPIGAKPVKTDDAWGGKLLLADLDDWLRKRGERIGALLIVGGPEIVPFHHLPNPVDDPDTDIPSDNPYATHDQNYFIPEWPVGRLPGGSGSDARLLLDTLRRFQAYHASIQRKISWKQRLSEWVKNVISCLRPEHRRSFGYTAEIWRDAAGSVFRSIGKPARMNVSPPCGVERDKTGNREQPANGLSGVPTPTGMLGYFNLHGVADTPDWYGHRDPMRFSNEPDYPVALRPRDVVRQEKGRCQVPVVVFSEACYGMQIHGRALDEAIALKFLEAGSLAVAGSTTMAYGSVSASPMVAADMLGYTFWRFLKQGMPAGEALRQAKIYLASEMHRRQDYLDGEDQKTLISFILYGDPLAEPLNKDRVPKSVRFLSKPLAEVRTICDREDISGEPAPVPMEVMDGVRRAVAKYLPGMTDARLAYVCEHESHSGSSEPEKVASDLGLVKKGRKRDQHPDRKNTQWNQNFRSLVTLSKQVARPGAIHPEIARLTLDEQGKLVKLVISR